MTLAEIERSIERIGSGWDYQDFEYGRVTDIVDVLRDLLAYLKERENARQAG